MLKEAKLAKQVSESAYDAEIASLLMAGANDLKIAGVTFEGEVTFSMSGDTVTDSCTVTDELIKRALITYAQANANWQSEARAKRYEDSYESMKERLMHATGYTDYGEEEPAAGGEGE